MSASMSAPTSRGIVLDASVAAKWYLPAARESLATEALEIFRDFAEGQIRLVVPDLFWPEFGNTLWKAVRIGRMSRKSAEESIASIEQIGMSTAPSGPLLKNAFAIAAVLCLQALPAAAAAVGSFQRTLQVTGPVRPSRTARTR